MRALAKLHYLRITPRKVRLVANLVRGKNVGQAQAILRFAVKKGSLPILKLLNSALASAKKNFGADEANLYVSKITVDEGPRLKRMMPRARGQAYPLFKRTSHVTIVLDERIPSAEKETAVPVAPQAQKEIARKEKTPEQEKPKFKVEREMQQKTQQVRGIQRIFRRKAI